MKLSLPHTHTHTKKLVFAITLTCLRALVCSFKYTNHSLFIIAVNFSENNSSTNVRTNNKNILQSNCVREKEFSVRHVNVYCCWTRCSRKIEWYAFSMYDISTFDRQQQQHRKTIDFKILTAYNLEFRLVCALSYTLIRTRRNIVAHRWVFWALMLLCFWQVFFYANLKNDNSVFFSISLAILVHMNVAVPKLFYVWVSFF